LNNVENGGTQKNNEGVGKPVVSLEEFMTIEVQPIIEELARWRDESRRDNCVIRDLVHGEEIVLPTLK
jgi:hypothetical protein